MKKRYLFGLILFIPIAYALSIDNIDFNRSLIIEDLYGVSYTPNCKEECHLPLTINYFGTSFLDIGVPKSIELTKKDIEFNFIDAYGNDNIKITDIRVLQDNKWVSLGSITMLKGVDYNIDIIGMRSINDRKPRATDVIPIINDISFDEFAWWNSTWDFIEGESENIFNKIHNSSDCSNGEIQYNLTEIMPSNFWNLTDVSNIVLTLNDTEVYYEYELWNFSKSNQTGFLNMTCIDNGLNLTIIYGVE